MKKLNSFRKPCLESLEDRTLLAVTAGGFELAAALPEPASATAWIVNTADDTTEWDTADDILSLREAIGRAQAGDTITFDSSLAGGTITLSGSELSIDKGITIDASDIGGMTISADGESRVFNVSGGTTDTPVELISLTITGGYAGTSNSNGGGIYNRGTLILTNCTVSGNSISGGDNEGRGGGIYNRGTLILTNCTVSGNTAYGDNGCGGGIYNYDSTLILTNCTVFGNIAYGYNFSGYDSGYGGGIYNYDGTLILTNCTVSVNTVFTFSDYTDCYGGGIYNNYGTLTLTNCTVSGNSVSGGGGGYGGGIYAYGTVNVYNTIIAQNTASSSYDDVYRVSRLYAYNTLSSFTEWARGSSGNLVYDSALPLFTDPERGDYTLAENSQAFDKGNNTYVETETDLAGNPRIVNGTVDIGAYEYQVQVEHEALSTVVTTALDITDPMDNLISLREAIAYAAAGDTVTFDSVLAGQTIILNGTELAISKGIAIDASSIGGMTIDANQQSRVFSVSGGTAAVPVELVNLTITGGLTHGGGGINNNGTLTLSHCVITGNTVNGGTGGGIDNAGVLTMTGCAISRNTASSNVGGGILNWKTGTATLTNCLLWGNTSDAGGGIYNNDNGIVTLTNCTISGNTSVRTGGGIHDAGGTVSFCNTIVAQNTASSSGNDVYGSGTLNAYNSLSSYTGWTNADGNNIVYTLGFPLFADAANGDYSLTAGSWAVNQGSNSCIFGYDTDITGNPRVFDGTVDIGAYEYQEEGGGVEFEIPSTVVTTALDITDPTDNLISLREAIAYAAAGDTVTFDSNLLGKTISLSGAQLEIRKNITIDASPIGGIAIDADGKSRVLYIGLESDDQSVVLIGLTFTGGIDTNYGGGIFCDDSSLIMTNCTVSGNTADYAGGIYSNEGELSLIDCIITGNSGKDGGGGVLCYDGTLTMTGCTVAENTSDYAGGILSYGVSTLTSCTVSVNASEYVGGIENRGTMTLIDCLVSENTGIEVGGIHNRGKLTLTGCTVSGNTADYAGGIYSDEGELSLIDCFITGNSGKAEGGGVLCYDGTLTMTGCTVAENTSDYAGGILSYGVSTLTGCTVSDNASEYVGGIENGGTMTLTDCLVSGNTGQEGGGIRNFGELLTLTGCTVSGNTAGSSGGGICSDEGELSLIDCIITGNSANYHESYNGDWDGYEEYCNGQGGGIFSNSVLMLTGCTVSENTASFGAGIWSVSATLTDCAITGNSAIGYSYSYSNFEEESYSSFDAYAYGGGVFNLGELTVTGCVISGNSACDIYREADDRSINGSGGGIHNRGMLTVINSVLSDNSAAGVYVENDNYYEDAGGGGIDNWGSTSLINCTVTGNESPYGGGIYNHSEISVFNTIIVQNSADFGGNDYFCVDTASAAFAYNTLSSYTDWTEHSYCPTYVSSLSLFADAANGDYTLAENSQAINKGNNEYVETETDLAGNPRIVGGTVDIGAYECQSGGGQTEPLTAPSITTGSKNVYVSYGANRHQIQWDAVENAVGYELAYSADGNSWTTVSVTGTSAVVTGLTYGANMTYRVRALGMGSYTDSDWSASKTFSVCPMDINNDEDISGGDRTLLAFSWLAEEGNENYRYYADINGDGDVSGADRNLLSANWLNDADYPHLLYPRPVAATAADAVFAAYASADLAIDLNIF